MTRITSVGLALLVLANAQDDEGPKTRIRRPRAFTPFSLDSPRNQEHTEGLSDFLFAELGDEDETFWINMVRRSAESMSLSMSMPNTDSSDDNSNSTDDNVTAPILNCDAVRNGTAPTSGPTMELRADVNITFYTEKWEAGAVSQIVYTVMNDYVRFWMLGCDAIGSRRLVEATMINVIMNETLEAGTCDSNISDTSCVSFNTPMMAIYTPAGGNVTSFQGRLDEAIIRAYVEGFFANVSVPGASGPNNQTDDVPGASVPNNQTDDTVGALSNKEGLSTAGAVGISVTALALLLFAALFLKRRRTTQHNETSAKQIRGDSFSLEDDVTQYSSSEPLGAIRRVVVGNSESFISDVSDGIVDKAMSPDTTSPGGLHAGIDVHVCQSSMCEACVSSKQRRLTFVQIGTASSPPCNSYQMTIMNAASEDFLIPDTLLEDYSLPDTISL